jgi:hypothetical protein
MKTWLETISLRHLLDISNAWYRAIEAPVNRNVTTEATLLIILAMGLRSIRMTGTYIESI